MDAIALARLCRILRRSRIASLGTLRGGAPLVSMVLYLPEPDFSAFYLRISQLAWHTQDLQRDARLALSIAETDDGRSDPQTLARVVIRGDAQPLAGAGAEYVRLKAAWLERYPQSTVTFELADFSFWKITPRDARFVSGFAQTHNLSADALRAAAREPA